MSNNYLYVHYLSQLILVKHNIGNNCIDKVMNGKART